MAEETSWRDLSDANVQAASGPLNLTWSISTLVKTMCSLSRLEDNFETPGTKRFYEGLAQNDMLYEKKSNYTFGQIENHRKSHTTRRPAHRLTLPRFPLKRRWSELALPTFFTTSQQTTGNKGQESDCLKTVRTSEGIENSASTGEADDAKKEETITFSSTTLDILCLLEDNRHERNHEAHDDASITGNDASDLISQTTKDVIYPVAPPQNGNKQSEIVSDIISMTLPSPSPNEEQQETPIASNKHSRRGWKGVRRQLRYLFRGLCCCLLTPSTKDTTSRVEDEAWACGT